MLYMSLFYPNSPTFGTKSLSRRRFLQHYYRDTFIESHRKPTDLLQWSPNLQGILIKMQHKQHFFIQNLPMSAKNTTFAAKFNKILAIYPLHNMQVLKIQKRLLWSSLFCIIVLTLSVYSSPTWYYACRQTLGTPRA